MTSKKNKAGKTSIQAVVNISGKIDPSLTKVINQVSGQMSKSFKDINKQLGLIDKGLTELNKQLAKLNGNVNKTPSLFSRVLSTVQKAMPKIKNFVGPMIPKSIKNGFKTITTSISSFGKTIKNKAAGVFNALPKPLKYVLSKTASFFSNYGGKAIVKSLSGIAKLGGMAVSKVGGALISGIMKMGSALGGSLISAGKQGIQFAVELQKVQKSVDVTFGGSSGEIDNWAKGATKGFGLSELQAKQFSSSMGQVLKSTGLPSGNIVKMSENLTQLTGDFSSFYKISQDDAFKKIQSAMSGDEGALNDLGINMSKANLQAYALSKGIKVSYDQMDEASKNQLRYNYLMVNTRNTQNDFANNSGTFTNQIGLLNTNFHQLTGNLMSKVLPSFSKCLQIVNNFMDGLSNNPAVMQEVQGALTLIFDEISSALPGILNLVQSLIPAIAQIAPLIIQGVINILPSVIQLIKAIIPVVQILIPVISGVIKLIAEGLAGAIKIVTPLIKWLADIISSVVSGIGKVGGFIGNFAGKLFGGGKINGFADGGIASSPSIFGEAGPEMAIPLQRNSRSMGLLSQTANILGANKGNGGPNVTVNLTINSSDGNPRTIAEAAEDAIIGVIEKYFGDKARVAYGE